MITVTEAARIAGVDPTRIRVLLKTGRVKGKLITKRMWLVNRDSLEQWIESPRKAGRPKNKSL
jgi:hypothetical protein